MLGRLICWWTGKHRRGRPVSLVGALGIDDIRPDKNGLMLQCPRCGKTWDRKARAGK
jgi:hypothetical protein